MHLTQQERYSVSREDHRDTHNHARTPTLGTMGKKGKKGPNKSQAQAHPTSQRNINFREDLLAEQLVKELLNMAGNLKKMPRKYTSPQERKRKRPRGTAWK